MHITKSKFLSADVFQYRAVFLVATSLFLSACATSTNAPIVHRTPSTETSEAKREFYTVGRGDTLSAIAQRFGVSTRDLVEWNGLASNPVLQAGQVMRVSPPDNKVVAAPPKPEVAQTGSIRPPVSVAVPVETKAAVKTGPKGLKRPYSDDTYAQMAKGDVAGRIESTVVKPEIVPVAAATPAVSPAVAAASTDSRTDNSGLVWSWPVPGKVMQNYDGGKSRGITLSGDPGKPVTAAAKGKVIHAKEFQDYGKLIIVSHGPDLVSIYAHNNSILVKEGQLIERGQKLGEQGPRVQFEVRRAGKPIDPAQYLPQR